MKVLYHASLNKDLDMILPQRTMSKDKYIGDFVFATHSKLLAVLYLAPKGYGTVMEYEENPPKIKICANEKEVRMKDKGGAIYTLDASLFHETPQKELVNDEYVSSKPVRPISKEVFSSIFDLWKDLGVKVEFISPEEYARLAY